VTLKERAAEQATREADVMAALCEMPQCGRASWLCRVINFKGPSGWCPVGPPRMGEHRNLPSVPTMSQARVNDVLRKMYKKGAIQLIYPNTRMMRYVLLEEWNEMKRKGQSTEGMKL